MAVKKVIITKSELPEIDASNFTYNIRYRIISDDKNRISHWSRIHNLDATYQIPTIKYDYNYLVENLTNALGSSIKAVRLSWVIPVNYQYGFYDIYVKNNSTGSDGLFHYYGTSYSNTYTIMQQSNETNMEVIVQAPAYPKVVLATEQRLFTTVVIPLVI